MMFKRTFIILLLGAASAIAQTPQTPSATPAAGTPAVPSKTAAPEKSTPEVETKIKIFRWASSNAMSIPTYGGRSSLVRSAPEGDLELWYQSSGAWKKILIVPGSMSEVINYKGPQKMVFCTKTVNADGETQYREMCSMMLTLGVDELFAMMFKRGNSVRFYPMNVSPKSLPKDKIAIINMTSHTIAVNVSGDTKTLGSGTNAIIAPKTRKDEYSVDLQIARMVEKKWQVVYQNSISTPDQKRCLVLIYDPSSRRSTNFSVQVLTL